MSEANLKHLVGRPLVPFFDEHEDINAAHNLPKNSAPDHESYASIKARAWNKQEGFFEDAKPLYGDSTTPLKAVKPIVKHRSHRQHNDGGSTRKPHKNVSQSKKANGSNKGTNTLHASKGPVSSQPGDEFEASFDNFIQSLIRNPPPDNQNSTTSKVSEVSNKTSASKKSKKSKSLRRDKSAAKSARKPSPSKPKQSFAASAYLTSPDPSTIPLPDFDSDTESVHSRNVQPPISSTIARPLVNRILPQGRPLSPSILFKSADSPSCDKRATSDTSNGSCASGSEPTHQNVTSSQRSSSSQLHNRPTTADNVCDNETLRDQRKRMTQDFPTAGDGSQYAITSQHHPEHWPRVTPLLGCNEKPPSMPPKMSLESGLDAATTSSSSPSVNRKCPKSSFRITSLVPAAVLRTERKGKKIN